MSEHPVLDNETVTMLKDVMGDEFQLLLETFVRDAPGRIDDLKKLLAENNIVGMERPAHTLKGSSGNIGARALSAVCAVLVNQIRANSVVDPEAQVAAIEQAFNQVKPLLLQFAKS